MRKTGHACITLAIAVLWATGVYPAVPDRVSCTLNDNFETGEFFAWEPYPYQQDIGYDALFGTRNTRTHNGSAWALARPVRSYYPSELFHGFTKRLNIWTVTDTRLKVVVFLEGDQIPVMLEFSLGLFDGRRYFHTITSPDSNTWLEINLPLSEFRDKSGKKLAAGEHVQAVTLTSEVKKPNKLTYTIYLDDFSLNGERQRQFIAKNPKSIEFEYFDTAILARHYFYGDTISLAVEPEKGAPLKSVAGSVLDSGGKTVAKARFYDDGTHGDTKAGDSIWTNDSIYRITENNACGQWEIKLTGTGAGSEVQWEFKFLVPGRKLSGSDHPRLLFSAKELADRIAGEKSPVAKKILENALAQNRGYEKADIASINDGHGTPNWRNNQTALGNIIYSGGFKYAVTGDIAAGNKAKEALLKLCSFVSWNPVNMIERHHHTYYPVGYCIRWVAYGYDLVYDLMTESERKLVRDAIMEKGIKMFHRDMVEVNRMPSCMTNHISVLVSGMGLAAITIYGDDPENPSLEPYLSGILTKTKTFIDRTFYADGSYGEPYGYQEMAMRELVELFSAFERNFGVDLTTTTNAKNFYLYPMYATYSSGDYPDYGDHTPTWDLRRPTYFWFANRIKDPLLYGVAKKQWDSGRGGYEGYLWFTEGITPVERETFPTSRMFEGQGCIVMRSGWSDNSTVVVFRAGPNSNHYHIDQGSLHLWANGQELIGDPGAGAGYYQPEYQMYNMIPLGHNVMLLDKDPLSQTPADYDNRIASLKTWPKMIQNFTGEIADAAESDLTSVYKGKVSSYTRTLLSTKSGPLFLFDKVKSPEGHEFDWLFHTTFVNTKNPITFSGNTLTIDREKARLTMNVVSPEIAGSEIKNSSRPDGYISLASKPNLNEAVFLAVLAPEAKPENGEWGTRPVAQRIDAPGWIGARAMNGDRVDIAMFKLDSKASGDLDGFVTDAARIVSTYEKGKLTKAYFEGSSIKGLGIGLKFTFPVTVAVVKTQSGADLEVKSSKTCSLAFTNNLKPSQVIVKGSPAKNWKYNENAGILTVAIPEGRNDISIK
jgi:hypothetical protein